MKVWRTRILMTLAVAAECFGCAGFAHADVFQAVDAQGVVHLSNIPSEKHYHVLIQSPAHPDSSAKISVAKPVRQASAKSYDKVLKKVAQEQHLDQALLKAVMTVESNNNPQAVSDKGAVGLMQLMPDTAQRYGVTDRYDPEENILGGARYLRDLLERYNENLPLVLAAYNAGEGAVDRYGARIPPYTETRHYVPKVMNLYRQYQTQIP